MGRYHFGTGEPLIDEKRIEYIRRMGRIIYQLYVPFSEVKMSKNRQELLYYTRKQMGKKRSEYNIDSKYDYFGVPAVHPRYRVPYRSIYPNGYKQDENQLPPSTLFRRTVLALCLFFVFLLCDYRDVSWNGIDTYVVEQKISSSESWAAVSQMIESLQEDL